MSNPNEGFLRPCGKRFHKCINCPKYVNCDVHNHFITPNENNELVCRKERIFRF